MFLISILPSHICRTICLTRFNEMLDSFNGDLLLNIKDYSPSGRSTVFSAEHVTPISETEISRNMAVASKRKRQDYQAEVMIRNRGKERSNVGIGAVVTISLDKRDVSSPTGVRAVVFNTKEETGGIQVCSEGGVICQNGKLFWIPCDRYRVTSSADESAVLTDGLTKIRNDILEHKFNVAMEKKISLNQAQKQFTGRSPRKKCICHCRGGRCGNRCGCRRKNNGKCSSACSCSGNCQNTC